MSYQISQVTSDVTSGNYADPEEIVELYYQRLQSQSSDIARMRYMQTVMNNDLVVPLPELQVDEQPAVANLMQQGMSQLARRVASIDPSHYFPSLDPASDEENKLAMDRGRVMSGWHQDNKLSIQRGRRARQFFAYATAPILITPAFYNAKDQVPTWHTRDPLNTFPADTEFQECCPRDCIFLTHHSLGWLLHAYPEQASVINKGPQYLNATPDLDQIFDVICYVSATESTMVLLGKDDDTSPALIPEARYQILNRARNLTDCCLAVVPGSINLDKQLGHFDSIVGMYQAQAALMSLGINAQRKAIWPTQWAVSDPNGQVEVVKVPEPYSGIPGEVRGGKIETMKIDPSIQALELQDRLSEAQMRTAGLPAEFGGFSPTNIRTGVRGGQVMSSTIDFTIDEAQRVFAESQRYENMIAAEIDKAYYPKRKNYYMATRAFSGSVTYTPSKLWATTKHIVDYPIAGVDLQNLPIEGGQRVQMQTMSRKRFMEIDPAIPDADREEQQIIREGVQTAVLEQIRVLASTPEGPYQPMDLAKLDKLVASGVSLYEAITTIQREAQERQAQQTADLAAQQPGLSLPGQGVEQPADQAQNPNADFAQFTQLLGQLGTVQKAESYR